MLTGYVDILQLDAANRHYFSFDSKKSRRIILKNYMVTTLSTMQKLHKRHKLHKNKKKNSIRSHGKKLCGISWKRKTYMEFHKIPCLKTGQNSMELHEKLLRSQSG